MDKNRRALIESCLYLATERQKVVVTKYLEVGFKQAAIDLDLNERTVYRSVEALIRNAERKGFSNNILQAPLPDFTNKRISTLVDSEGKIKQQWLIQEKDKETEWLAMQGALDNMMTGLPAIPEINLNPDIRFNDNLLNQYTLTDYHLGMLAWHKEGGYNWDLKIGKKTLIELFKYLIEHSPPAEVGVFCNIGDFMHYDGWVPVTPLSGHILDTEGRFPKIVDAAVDTMLTVIGMLLKKHKKVVVVNMQGNHDLASAYWLQKICQVVYSDNNRVMHSEGLNVQIDRIILPYHAFQWGETALFWHHGHKKSLKDQGRMYPAQFPVIWGNTKYRYGHTGHNHKTEVIEEYGVKVERHNAMCARDAYASHGGWFSERSANVITYHKEHGEVGRNYVKPSMLNI